MSAAPPAAPRPFRFGALTFGASFPLLFGGIWVVVGLPLLLALAVHKDLVIAAFPVVIGLPIFLYGVLVALDQRKTYMHGRAAEAKVVAVRLTSRKMNRRRVHEIDLTFETDAGATRGTIATLDPPRVGDVIWVIYRPDAPHKTIGV